MPDSERPMIYAAAYGNVTQTLPDLGAIEQLRKDELIGSYDAAVIDKCQLTLVHVHHTRV
jgi:hypothetical protein